VHKLHSSPPVKIKGTNSRKEMLARWANALHIIIPSSRALPWAGRTAAPSGQMGCIGFKPIIKKAIVILE
jgi:hypothetical protein